jgi:site-specific recombinase XerD
LGAVISHNARAAERNLDATCVKRTRQCVKKRYTGDTSELAKLPFPIHPHMLRHACGFKLANDGVGIARYSLLRRICLLPVV